MILERKIFTLFFHLSVFKKITSLYFIFQHYFHHILEGARDTEKALHSLAQYLDDETNTGRISEQVKAQILGKVESFCLLLLIFLLSKVSFQMQY